MDENDMGYSSDNSDLSSNMLNEFIERAKKEGTSDNTINEYVKATSIVPLNVVVEILSDIENSIGSNLVKLSQLRKDKRKMITAMELTDIISSVNKQSIPMLSRVSKENRSLTSSKILELMTLRNKYFLGQKIKSLQNQLSSLKNMNDISDSNKNEGIHNAIRRHAGDLNISSIKGVSTFRGKDLLKRLEQVNDLQTIYDDWSDKMDSMDLTDEYVEIVNNIRSNFEKDRYADVSEGLGKLCWAFPSNAETKKFLELIKIRQRHTFR